MKEYTFPFSTCEKPNKKGIAQPWSAAVNVLSIFIIFYFLLQVKKWYPFLLILSLLVFECVHTFSHIIHLSNYIQVNSIHILTYVINFCCLQAFYNYTHKAPSPIFLMCLVILLSFDIYAFLFLSFIFYFSSSIFLFFSILIYYYSYLPKEKQNYIFTILGLGTIILLFFYNEKMNCEKMLFFMPNFPFHALLELTGTFIFYLICKFFSSL